MTQTQRAFLELHIAVILWGITAILGKIIDLPALTLVWWRVLLTCGFIVFVPQVWRDIRQMSPRLRWQLCGVGIIVVLHWLTFYASIKLSSPSVALICMATTSFQSALLEPLIRGYKIRWYEVSLGLIIVPGMVYIAGDLPDNMLMGLFVGIFSSVLVVIFSILNKTLVEKASPLSITLIELGGGNILLTALLPVFYTYYPTEPFLPSWLDWQYLFVLAFFCTNIAYYLSIRSLKHLSAFATNLTVNLEPIYGITLAWLLLGDNKNLNPSFYWGASLILLAVLSYPLLKSRFEK